MPPRTLRLNKKEIETIVKNGRFLHIPSLATASAACKALAADNFKIGVTVSKKVAAKATERNLLRRKWYNALYRAYLSEKEGGRPPKGWYMIQLRPGALQSLSTLPHVISLPHILL